MAQSEKNGAALRAELDWLTALRIFAALWVVVHHFGVGIQHLPALGWCSVSLLLERGSTGVGFFFVLSGYILAHAYSAKSKNSRRGFYVNRFARIYPVYVLALILGFPALIDDFQLHISHHGLTHGVAMAGLKSLMVLTLTQAWIPSAALFWNGVSWSLSAEAFFYSIFPSAFPWLRSRKIQILTLVVLCAFLAQGLTHYAGSLGNKEFWGFFPLFRVPDFILGMCLQILVSRGYQLPKWAAIPGVVGFVLLQTIQLPGAGGHVAQTVASYLLIGVMIVSLSYSSGERPRHWMMKVMVLLGNASYAVYLLQFPVMNLWKKVVPAWSPMACMGYLVVLIGTSIAVYLWIEHPLRDRIRASLAPRPPKIVEG